jgi:hypothetical protein
VAVFAFDGVMENRTFRADDRLNELNDRDDMWGPLLFLRPQRHQVLTPGRALLISALLGGFFGMLGNVILGLLQHMGAGYRPAIWAMPGLLTGMYFVCGQLSLFAAWNRRARLLSRRLDWAELTGRPLPPPRDDQQPAD